jgi:hypothetical protein
MRPRNFVPLLAGLLVASPAASQTAPVSATRVTTIGCESCGDARELGSVSDIVISGDGELILLDLSEPSVRRFARDGRLITASGRKGSGPGEFNFPMRGVLGPDRSLRVLDMRLRRITQFAPDGEVRQTVSIGSFVAASAARRGAGDLLVLLDDFRGNLTLQLWPLGSDTARVVVAKIPNLSQTDGTMRFPSIAMSPGGELALARDVNEYRISRFSPAGAPLGDITRDVERVRRTPEEEARLKALQERTRERVSAEAANRGRAGGGGGGRAPAPAPPRVGTDPSDLALKPHFPIDGLRYDDEGRLWILTSRAPAGQTLFDLFGPEGRFLGALTVPATVTRFAVGSGTLVTAGEDDNGVPVVTVWRLTER